jgi:hypothetical protein
MRTLCLLLLLTLISAGASAAHITDKLVVGLYADEKLEGKPLKLLTSGTPVEVVARGSGTVQVRMADDTRGWLEARYVSEEKPAAMKLLEVQTELRRLKAQLKAQGGEPANGEGQLDSEAQTPSAAESESLPSAAQARAEQELENANARIAQLEAQLADLPRLQAAALQRNALQARLNRVRELLGVENRPATDNAETAQASPWDHQLLWIVAAVTALLGFAAGMLFLDYRFRRRHGGFRL